MNIRRSLRRVTLASALAVAILPGAASAAAVPDEQLIEAVAAALVQAANTAPPGADLAALFNVPLLQPGVTCDVAVAAINRARQRSIPRASRQYLASLIWNLPACASSGSLPLAAQPPTSGPGLGPTGGGSDYTGT